MATYKPKVKKADQTVEEVKIPISTVDGLQDALDGKQASGSYVTTGGTQTVSGVKTFSSADTTFTMTNQSSAGYREIPINRLGKVGTSQFQFGTNSNLAYDPSTDTLKASNFTGNSATATSAEKLSNTSAIGSATKPVYFNSSGVPVAGTYTLGGACAKGVRNNTTKGSCGWSSTTTDATVVPTMNTIAYWDGSYNSSHSSNLTYCTKGEFGSAVTKDYVSSITGSANVPTDSAVKNYVDSAVTIQILDLR